MTNSNKNHHRKRTIESAKKRLCRDHIDEKIFSLCQSKSLTSPGEFWIFREGFLSSLKLDDDERKKLISIIK